MSSPPCLVSLASNFRAAIRLAVVLTALVLLAWPVAAAEKNGVSPQTISLPSGPGSIEGLGESFEPQLNTGTATYSVSFALPPGRAGVGPSLGLHYNGGSPNGLVGLGWTLGGSASIRRQSDKGLPAYDETASFSGTDVFLSPAGEELVPLSDGSFRAENEGGFARYRYDRPTNTWTGEQPDGSVLVFGAHPDARVEEGGRTAKWFATSLEDTNGNRIEYEYVRFPGDSPGQIYPSRIFYTRHASQSLTGEHVVALTWEARPDPIHDFRCGFEVTTGRRLARVDACTVGGSFTPASTCDGVGVPGAARVRAYRLDYDDVGACAAGTCQRGLPGNVCSADADCVAASTQLAGVTQLGDDGVSELPALSFSYTDLDFGDDQSWRAIFGYPVAGAGSPEVALADLNADGLPDVLESPTSLPGTLRRWLNQGPDDIGVVQFGTQENFIGPDERLSTPGTQLADFDGDGRSDLLTRPSVATALFEVRPGNGRGFFSLTSDTFIIQDYNTFSTLGFEDPQVRMVDLDFDKRIDVLRTVTGFGGATTELRVRMTRSNVAGDYLAPHVTCAAIPDADFANGRTFLVDMNGDRMLDLVTLDTSPLQVDVIRYYPATGGGAFGVGSSCGVAGAPVVLGGSVVSNLPIPGEFLEFKNFVWRDLTNDGLADLVWLGPDGISVFVNQGGETLRRIGFPGGYTVEYPGSVDYDPCDPQTSCNPLLADRMEFVDMNGNGTTDVVHIDQDTGFARYWDTSGPIGVPPRLLRTIDNGIGRMTTIDYEPSTTDYLESLEPGATPWRIRSPFPVTIVARKRVKFGLDLDGTPGEDEYVTDYRYRDAFYDAVEKEFRGFAEVEAIARGDAAQPTLVTRHHFHTGGPDGVDNDGDGLVDEHTPLGGAEEESLKGVLLEQRTETCTDGPDGVCPASGAVFLHDYSRFEIRSLYGATGMVCSGDASVGCCADIDCASPALGGSCIAGGTVEPGRQPEIGCEAGKSVHWAVTTGQRSAVIELGTDPRVDLMSEMDYDDFGNGVVSNSWGIVDAPDLPPFGCVLATGVCSSTPNQTCGSDVDCFGAETCEKISVADGGAVCAGDPFSFSNAAGLVDERLVASSFAYNTTNWLLRCEQEVTISDASSTVEARARNFYDDLPLGQCSKGNPTRNEAELIQGSRFIPGARSTYDAFGNVVEILDARSNRRTVAFDLSFATFPSSETVHLDGYDISATASYHEGFGTVVGSTTWAITGSGPAYSYHYDAFARIAASVEPGDSPASPTFEYEYHLNELDDGISFLTVRTRESPSGGTIDTHRFVDGLERHLGTKVEGDSPGEWLFREGKAYGRRGSERSAWLPFATNSIDYEIPPASGDQSESERDALGRVVTLFHPGSASSQAVYHPLATDNLDENDTAGITPGAYKTVRNDGLGRLIEVTERNPSDGETLVTFYTFDARGNLLTTTDAQGNVTLNTYDSLSRKTFLNHVDRGYLDFVYDDAGNVTEALDAKAQRIVMTYDLANRLSSENYLDVTGVPLTDPVDVTYFYDRLAPGGVPHGDGTVGMAAYTAGELAYAVDATGEEHRSYDERRRSAWIVKRVRDPQTGTLASYTDRFSHDSANRRLTHIYPDGDAVESQYGPRGLLQHISGTGGGLELISDIAYNPSGQTERVVFGNGATSDYSYDQRLRLTGIRTLGAGATAGVELVDYEYTLDPASNVVEIADDRSHIVSSDPRLNYRFASYDDLHRITNFSLVPGFDEPAIGTIAYDYDKLGNLVSKTSDLIHDVDGKSITDIGTLAYGGSGGSSGRIGRDPGGAPGPHAPTSTDNGTDQRAYQYDDNGNMSSVDGTVATWDFKDRLAALENDRMRAEYAYDYSDRRISKKVTWKAAAEGWAAGDVHVTLYPSRDFEVRVDRQPVKFVSRAGSRIAEITGTLDGAASRIQRFVFHPGWNHFSIAVDVPDAAAQLGLGQGGLALAYLWQPVSDSYVALGPGSPLPAGSVVWVFAGQATEASVRGSYTAPFGPVTLAPGEFAPVPGLEQIASGVALPANAEAWLWDEVSGRWRERLASPLDSFSDLPPIAGPNRVLYLRTAAGGELVLPPAAARVRFYHGDYVGSVTVKTDYAGEWVEEAAFYPYGEPRLRTSGTEQGLSSAPYLFLARERDRESGFFHLGARSYIAPMAAFLSVDPMVSRRGVEAAPRVFNGYGYSVGNPYRFRDPSGLDTEGEWFKESTSEDGSASRSEGKTELSASKGHKAAVYTKSYDLENWGDLKIEFGVGQHNASIGANGIKLGVSGEVGRITYSAPRKCIARMCFDVQAVLAAGGSTKGSLGVSSTGVEVGGTAGPIGGGVGFSLDPSPNEYKWALRRVHRDTEFIVAEGQRELASRLEMRERERKSRLENGPPSLDMPSVFTGNEILLKALDSQGEMLLNPGMFHNGNTDQLENYGDEHYE